MKGLMLAAILALTMIALTACNTEEDTGEFTVRHFHADLDYMLHTLENNFALFDAAYWARGVDIYAIVDDVRAEIDADPDMNVDGFYDALTRNFEPLQWVAHFEIINPQRYLFFMEDSVGSMVLTNMAPSSFARLRYPHVVAFYEARLATPEVPMPQSLDDTVAYLIERDDSEIQYYINRFVEILTTLGERELAMDIAIALGNRDFEEVTRLIEKIDNIFTNADSGTNIAMDIIEEGRIAYLSVLSFANTPGSDTAKTFAFYEEIQDFGHLIIDLRHSGGGNHAYFVNAIVAPNIAETVVLDAFYFLVDGEYSLEVINPRIFQVRAAAGSVKSLETDLGKMSIDDILAEFHLPQFNIADAERLQYGIHSQLRIQPERLAAFDGQPAFNGTTWVLTGSQMGSASQIAAWVAKESGFATLVGDITGGNYGGLRTLVALPNSGILFQMDMFYVTDGHGRPLEAGTIPHYFNRPGIDALETVLVMIEESER